jgi:hypothetical protein
MSKAGAGLCRLTRLGRVFPTRAAFAFFLRTGHNIRRPHLLSRINGDAPRAVESQSGGVWIVREQAGINLQKLLVRAFRTRDFAATRSRSQTAFELLFTLPRGGIFSYVNETLRR